MSIAVAGAVAGICRLMSVWFSSAVIEPVLVTVCSVPELSAIARTAPPTPLEPVSSARMPLLLVIEVTEAPGSI